MELSVTRPRSSSSSIHGNDRGPMAAIYGAASPFMRSTISFKCPRIFASACGGMSARDTKPSKIDSRPPDLMASAFSGWRTRVRSVKRHRSHSQVKSLELSPATSVPSLIRLSTLRRHVTREKPSSPPVAMSSRVKNSPVFNCRIKNQSHIGHTHLEGFQPSTRACRRSRGLR